MSKFNDLPVLPLGLHPLLWFLSHVPAAFAPRSDETLPIPPTPVQSYMMHVFFTSLPFAATYHHPKL